MGGRDRETETLSSGHAASGGAPSRARAIARLAIPAAIAVPVVSTLVLLLIEHRRDVSLETSVAVWVELEILALGAIGVLTAFAIRSAEWRRRATELRLEELAHRDSLTGLLNRRGLEAEVARRQAEPPRTDASPALIVIDLDGFKQVNDSHGHAAGDRALVTVAAAIRASAQDGDIVSRLGGDEFAVVFCGSEAETAARVAAIRTAVATATAAIEAPELGISTGAVTQTDGATAGWAGFALERLLRAADRDLYAARGRPVEDAATQPAAHPAPAPAPSPTEPPATAPMPRLDEALVRRLARLTIPCAALAAAIGLAGMAGVLLDLTWLRATNEEAALAFASCLGIALAAASVILRADENGPAGRRLLGSATAAAFGLIGAIALVEHLLGTDLAINTLVSDPIEVPGISRPDPETAAGLLCGSVYLLLIDVRNRVVRALWGGLAIVVALIALGAVFSAMLGAGYIWHRGDDNLISIHGAVAAAALCVGMLTMRPRRLLFWPITIDSPAGHATRRLVTAALAIPLVSGMLLVLYLPAGALPTFVAALTAVQVVLLLLIARATIRTVEAADAESEALAWRLRELADCDPLTGLFNRRRLEFEFAEEVARRRGDGGSSALVVLDLNSLKRINDTYGHAAGDAALVQLAATLRERTGPADTVARIGGDEFALLLANVTEGQARAWAVSCAEAAADSPAGPSVPVSWGISMFGATSGGFDEHFHRADLELYAAKRSPDA